MTTRENWILAVIALLCLALGEWYVVHERQPKAVQVVLPKKPGDDGQCLSSTEPLQWGPCATPITTAGTVVTSSGTLTSHTIVTGTGKSAAAHEQLGINDVAPSHLLDIYTPETLRAKQLADIKKREKLPLFFITSAAHDCDHAPLQAHGTDRLDAWSEATKEAEEADDKEAIKFLSVPMNYITAWTEAEWRDAEKRIGNFEKDCEDLKRRQEEALKPPQVGQFTVQETIGK